MKYFTLRSPPKNMVPNGKDKNGKFVSMNGSSVHSSANNLSKLDIQDPMASTSSHYFYAQPRQRQRPQLAQQFNLKSCNSNKKSKIVGNSNGVIGNQYNGIGKGFVAPKSAPLPRKCYYPPNNLSDNGFQSATKRTV